MAGSPEFTRITELQANPSKRLRQVSYSDTTEIMLGGEMIVSIFAPVGYVSHIVALQLQYPIIAAATSGSKEINFRHDGGSLQRMLATGAFGSNVKYINGQWLNTTTAEPADATAQFHAQNMYFDENHEAWIRFINNTNANDGSVEKMIQVRILDEKIAG